MPHYRDGTEARIGDIVRGSTYNHKGRIVGTLVSVTPGSETCNCTVAFASLVALPALPTGAANPLGSWYGVFTALGCNPPIIHQGGNASAIVGAYDYGEVRALELVERPGTGETAEQGETIAA